MNAESSDVARALAAIGAPPMVYRSFAAPPGATAAEVAADGDPFPLLAACLPAFAAAVSPLHAEAATDEPPAVAPVMALVPPLPVNPAPASPGATPLERVFGALRGGGRDRGVPAAPRGLHDLFRRL